MTLGSMASSVSVASLVPPPAGSGRRRRRATPRNWGQEEEEARWEVGGSGAAGSSAPFSDEELVALDAAVAMYPVAGNYADANERWRKIAAQVSNGRTKKQCYDAYKALIASRKEAAKGEAAAGCGDG